MKHFLLLVGTVMLLTSVTARGREVTELKDWKFYPAYDVSRNPKTTDVTVPHSWNLTDVFQGMKYERGTYVYERMLTLDGEQRKDKRFFLKFDGVNSYAEVAVNQHYAGQHAGGYTAFCMEITELLNDGENKISVMAGNAYRTDIAPLAGDFNMYGGIVRPVWLIVTGQDCISPLDYGSSGVYVHQDKVTPAQADLRIETMLSLPTGTDGKEVRVSIIDREGKTVAEQKSQPSLAVSHSLDFSMSAPHLWNGRQDPYLYKVRVELLQDGRTIDCIEEQTGLRFFSLDADRGFFLNGRHLDLHGVCRHEEGCQTGNLYNEEAMRQDADIISELGCTGVRFVHYPHSRYDVRQYDERGIVVWQELNLAGPGGYNSPGYVKNPHLEQNVMQNLIEMVKQHYNSPAICFWSLCNELSFKYDEPATFLKQLHAKAKQLDPKRLTTLAICYDQDRFQGITDCLGWNKYFGYYENKGGVGEFMDKAHREAGTIPIGLCEYGAAGSTLQHGFERKVTNKIHYEENQARVHEENWREMQGRDYAWCKFIWQYADNPSSIRNEGDQRGMNDKGIVTYDRQTRKDAYYFYKANWSTEPVLYIAARRYTQRTDAMTDVKVYTNQPTATLWLNGKRIGKGRKDDIGRIVFSNVELREGDNTITVRSGTMTDECRCTLNSDDRKEQITDEEVLDGAVGDNAKDTRPRILVSSDIGGTDPDDNQSMLHLLMYNDLFQIEGLVSSPSFGDGSKQEILKMIGIYEKDYPKLKAHIAAYHTPDELRALCKQGRKGLAPYCGFDKSTEGSEWIVKCARKEDDSPLYVLVWGTLEDVAQALHDAPDIAQRIRVYWIGGPNKKWGVNSYAYIAENFPDLWIIENNASYRGFIANGNKDDKFNNLYYDSCLKGAGNIGADFANYYGGKIKMGDSPSLFYMMNGDAGDPCGESWGGSFERMAHSPRTVFTRNTTEKDTVAVYSIVEFRFADSLLDKPAGTPCFVMTIDRQDWNGCYLGDGQYGIRYAPKAPATLTYKITSDIAELNGHSGVFVVSGTWQGEKAKDGYSLGNNWFTDKKDTTLFEGQWQGSKTVSKWREAVLSDWETRLKWLK